VEGQKNNMQRVVPEKGWSPQSPQGIATEMALMLRRAREVWRLVPRKHKWALGGAVVVMVCTSACSTALALFLGQLVDGVKPDRLESQSNAALYRMAALWLGLIGAAYVVREILNVLRRYLVTNTCTRINRDMRPPTRAAHDERLAGHPPA